MDSGVDHQADRAPDVALEAAVVAVRVLVEANILAQLLRVETPPFAVSRVPEVFAKIGNVGEFLGDRNLQMVSRQALVIRPVLDISEGPRLKLIGVDINHTGPGTIRRAVFVVGCRLILLAVRGYRHDDHRGFGQTPKELRQFGAHAVEITAIGIQKLLFAAWEKLGVMSS